MAEDAERKDAVERRELSEALARERAKEREQEDKTHNEEMEKLRAELDEKRAERERKDTEFEEKVKSFGEVRGSDDEFRKLMRHDPFAMEELFEQMKKDEGLTELHRVVTEIEENKDVERAEEYFNAKTRIHEELRSKIAKKMEPVDSEARAKEFQALLAKKLEGDLEFRSLHEAIKTEADKTGATVLEYMHKKVSSERWLQKQAEVGGERERDTKELAYAVNQWKLLFEDEGFQRPELVDSFAGSMKRVYERFTSLFDITVSSPNDDVVERVLRLANDDYNHQLYNEVHKDLPKEVEKAHAGLKDELKEQYLIRSTLRGLTDGQLRDKIKENPQIVGAMRKIGKRVRGKVNQTHVKKEGKWTPRK